MALTNLSQITTSGIATGTDLNIRNITGAAATFTGNVTVGGTLTYEDVTNIDSVGLITARSGINVTGGDVSVADKIVHTGDTDTSIRFLGPDTITAETAGSERLRITNSGLVGIGTVNPTTALEIRTTTTNAATHYRNNASNSGAYFGVRGADLGAASAGEAYIYSYNSGINLLADGSGHIDFATGGTASKVRITSGGKVLINSTANSDAQLLVKSADKLHPALKLDSISANGFSLLGDEYLTDESNFTMGIAYSSASLVTGWGVKVSPTAVNEYLSSQDTYSTKHSAVRHDGDGWKFLSNSSSQTVTTDSVVSLTERIRISSDGKILKGMTSSILGNSDVQLTGSGGPAKIAGYKSDNNPTSNTSMLTVTGYSQSGGTFTSIGEIDFSVNQNSNTASGYHPGSIVTRVNGGSTTGTHAGAAYSYAGLKDRERITFKSKRYYSLPEWVSGSDTYNLFREEWDYQHYVGYNRYSWYRFTSHSSSSSRGGSVDIRVTWSTRHAGGNGYGHWAFHWRDSHANGYMEIGNVYKYHSSYLGGSYYGWSSNPNLHVYEINDSGNNAGFYLRVQGHVDANGSTYDGGVMHQFLISAHTNRLGADVNKFEFVGNSTPSDVGSQQGNVNLP